jgi:hypothetical protein
LFVGVELFTAHAEGVAEVRGIVRNRAVLRLPDGREELTRQDNGFKWRMNPKVSGFAAEITELSTDRAYAPYSDPERQKIGQQMSLMNYYADEMSRAEHGLRTMEQRMAAAEAAANNPFNTESQSFEDSAAGIEMNTMQQYQAANDAMSNFQRSSLFDNSRGGEDDPDAEYDALEVSFEVSSPVTLPDAYVVVRSRIRPKDEGFMDINFIRSIGPVGPEPRQVRVAQYGLPPAFEHIESKIHLFQHSEEIPTNHSERHLPLTSAEAREYLMMDHLAQNRGDDAEAQVAWSLAPTSLRSLTTPDTVDFDVLVEVDESGELIAIKNDNGSIVPGHVREILPDLIYLPALQEGRPVTSTTVVNLADYFR